MPGDCVHNFLLFELATRLSPRLCWLLLYFRLIFPSVLSRSSVLRRSLFDSMSSSASSSTIHQNVVPSEVGWQFVPQYYTFVNKQPNRLHCFYTKSSTFVHGNEGEESKPCFGQHVSLFASSSTIFFALFMSAFLSFDIYHCLMPLPLFSLSNTVADQ